MTLTTKAAVGVAAAVLVFFLWINRDWGGDAATQAFSDLTSLAAPLAAAGACAVAARRSSRRPLPNAGAAWRLLSAACAAWGVGQAFWSYYELVLGQDVPFPGVADLGFLLLIPLAAGAVSAFPSAPGTATSRMRFRLDAIIIAGSVMFLSWALVLGPTYRAAEGTLFEKAVGLAYPLGDAVILTFLVVAIVRARPSGRAPLLLVAAGLGAIAISDSAFAVLTATGAYATGGPTDVGWFAGFLLIGLGAVRYLEAPPIASQEERRSSLVGIALPVLLIALCATIAGARELQDGVLEPFLFWNAMVIIGAVVGRQFMVLVDNERLARQTQDAFSRLQEAENLRIQLLNNVAHDLGSPLSPVTIQLHLLGLDATNLRPDQEQGLKIIRRNVEHVKILLADLQDVAKMQAGRLKLQMQPSDLSQAVKTACESLTDNAASRGVRLTASARGVLVAKADPARINQVLYNLINNALKFTPPGGTIGVTALPVGSHVRVSVSDSGRGLDPTEIPRLFKPFSQVHQPSETKERGTGLGLYICHGILERHGGRIWAESQGRGHGSTFSFELPVEAMATIPATPAPEN